MDYLASNKIAIIDLATAKVTTTDLDDALVKEHIGGAGVTRALYERYQAQDPVVIGSGLLTGSLVTGAALGVMTARSPRTNGLAHVPLLLNLGLELKLSGFDYLVLVGQSPKPVYLWLHDGIADIKDAAQLWGQDVWTAVDAVRLAMGDDLIQVLAIGEAGERLCPQAQVTQNYWGSADRFGFGQVLGRKLVKLLAIRGLGLLELADAAGFVAGCADLLTAVQSGAGTWKTGLAGLAAAAGEDDLTAYLAPITHRHRANFNTPLAYNTFVYVTGDPKRMAEPTEPEPGFLLNDLYGVLALKALGLSAVDAARAMMAMAKAGLDPLAVAESTKALGADTYQAIKNVLSGAPGQAEKPVSGPFSPWCPQKPLSPGFGAQDEVWWRRRQAVAYLFGLDPVFSLMAPEIDETRLLELANLATDLDLTPETLDGAVAALLG